MKKQLSRLILAISLCIAGCTDTAIDAAPVQLAVAGAAAAADPGLLPRGKLGDAMVPERYLLRLEIDPREERFSGLAQIDARLRLAQASVYLHGNGLEVSRVSLSLEDGEVLEAEYTQVDAGGVARLDFPRVLQPQSLRIVFEYTAPLRDVLDGAYRVEDGGRRYVFTQLEAVAARTVFPGFDEPVFKTPYELTLEVPAGMRAVANTPLVERLPLENGMQQLRFAPTPPLPSYLLAFAVGELDIVEGPPLARNRVRDRAVPLRGVAVAGKGEQLAVALSQTGALLEVLEEYFDMPYPYRKLDIIAVPDFEAGAMENPGAITFRENLLLIKPHAPISQRQGFARVMAHELAHMWFGDLVTMPWWDDIWLNESFATWMSYKAIGQWNPSHEPESAMMIRLRRAMHEDALMSSRQIRQDVAANHDIAAAFDGITYAKGAAVLAMFERFIGPDAFRQALRTHVRKFAHGSADVNDFIESLSTAADRDIGPALRSFLFQSGIPFVYGEMDCASGDLTLTQQRYLPTGSSGTPGQTWQLPVCVRYGIGGAAHEQCALLTEHRHTLRLDEGKCPDWLLPNAGFAGYYHWALAPKWYDRFDAATLARLSKLEQLSIVDSVEAGLDNGTLTIPVALRTLQQLSASQFPAAVRATVPLFEFVADYLVPDAQTGERVSAYLRGLYPQVDASKAFDPDYVAALPSDAARLMVADVARFKSRTARDPAVRDAAYARALQFLGPVNSKRGLRPELISANSLQTALEVVVQRDGAAGLERLLGLLAASRDAQLRNTLLRAIGHVTEPELGERVRALALSGMLRDNEIETVLRAHVEEAANRDATWGWLQAEFDALTPRLPLRHAARLGGLVSPGCDLQRADAADEFLTPRMEAFPGGPRAIAKSLERMRLCAKSVPMLRKQTRDYFMGYRGR